MTIAAQNCIAVDSSSIGLLVGNKGDFSPTFVSSVRISYRYTPAGDTFFGVSITPTPQENIAWPTNNISFFFLSLTDSTFSFVQDLSILTIIISYDRKYTRPFDFPPQNTVRVDHVLIGKVESKRQWLTDRVSSIIVCQTHMISTTMQLMAP